MRSKPYDVFSIVAWFEYLRLKQILAKEIDSVGDSSPKRMTSYAKRNYDMLATCANWLRFHSLDPEQKEFQPLSNKARSKTCRYLFKLIHAHSPAHCLELVEKMPQELDEGHMVLITAALKFVTISEGEFWLYLTKSQTRIPEVTARCHIANSLHELALEYKDCEYGASVRFYEKFMRNAAKVSWIREVMPMLEDVVSVGDARKGV